MEVQRQLNIAHSSVQSSPTNTLVAGIDEAGRGCLAGPVVAAAVILDPANPIYGLADSKSLKPQKREELATKIKKQALAWSLGLCWQKRIDKINILHATFEAMAKAALSLKLKPAHILIDGSHCIPESLLVSNLASPPLQSAIIRGDQTEDCISAASILAKCYRDKLMCSLSRKWPNYGFARHKGYGTKEHLRALQIYGPCPLHRMTFKRVRPEPELI